MIKSTQVAAPRREPEPREYTSVTINFETAVLAKAKETQRVQARQFRSVSAFVNYHMAVVLGLEAPKPDSV